MFIAAKNISIQNETFILTNQRALFWEREKALVLSDLHIGKTAHFRKNGIALANQIMKSDLQRLSALIEYFRPEKFIVVGDLLHAGDNSDVDEFCIWKNQYPEIQFYLIEGNHDRISKALENKLCFHHKAEWLAMDPVTFIHDFDTARSGFQITGHIHPGIVLHSAVKESGFRALRSVIISYFFPLSVSLPDWIPKICLRKVSFLFLQIRRFMKSEGCAMKVTHVKVPNPDMGNENYIFFLLKRML